MPPPAGALDILFALLNPHPHGVGLQHVTLTGFILVNEHIRVKKSLQVYNISFQGLAEADMLQPRGMPVPPQL